MPIFWAQMGLLGENSENNPFWAKTPKMPRFKWKCPFLGKNFEIPQFGRKFPFMGEKFENALFMGENVLFRAKNNYKNLWRNLMFLRNQNAVLCFKFLSKSKMPFLETSKSDILFKFWKLSLILFLIFGFTFSWHQNVPQNLTVRRGSS